MGASGVGSHWRVNNTNERQELSCRSLERRGSFYANIKNDIDALWPRGVINNFGLGRLPQKLLDLAAGSRGLKLTEFAIGVNEAITPSIDYKINSQMNEGISGVHLAIGDGSSRYHIDFLSPAVSVSPIH